MSLKTRKYQQAMKETFSYCTLKLFEESESHSVMSDFL